VALLRVSVDVILLWEELHCRDLGFQGTVNIAAKVRCQLGSTGSRRLPLSAIRGIAVIKPTQSFVVA